MITLPSAWLNSRIYDLSMRMPVTFITLFLSWRELHTLRSYVAIHPFFDGDLAFLAGLLAHIGVMVFLLFLGCFNAMRRRPVQKFGAWTPKLAAIMATGLVYLVLLLPHAKSDYAADVASAFFTLLGSYLCLVSVSSLGRSLSTMPEARKLVTHGLYAYIRHPLYMSEMIAFVGLFLQFRSWQAALILLTVVFFQLKRMDFEESILITAFPEYGAYRQNSWRLFPGIY